MSSRLRSYHPTKLARAIRPRGSQPRISDPGVPPPAPPAEPAEPTEPPASLEPGAPRSARRPAIDIFVPPPRRPEPEPEGAALRSTLRAGTIRLATAPVEGASNVTSDALSSVTSGVTSGVTSSAVSGAPAQAQVQAEASPRALAGGEAPRDVGDEAAPIDETPASRFAPVRTGAETAPREPAGRASAAAPTSAPERPERPEHPERLPSSGDLGEHADFFTDGEGSLAPVTDPGRDGAHLADLADPADLDELGDGVRQRALSPAAVERRARLRRMVSGVVAFTGVVALAVIGNAAVSGKKAASVDQASALSTPAPPAAPPKPEAPAAKPASLPKAPEPAAPSPEKASAEEPALADDAPAEPDPEKAKDLKKEALRQLNRGNLKGAIESSRASIAADPTDALPYLYLGSALQDTGKWKESREAFSECVRNATKGPVYECRAMGGRK